MESNSPDRHAGGGAQITDAVVAGRHQVPVLTGADTGVDPGAAAPQPVRIHPGILKRLPTRLQHHAMPGIQITRLDRRHPEEACVEFVDLVHKRATAVRGVPGRNVPSEIAPGIGTRSPVSHRVHTRFEQTPKGREIRSAGEAARHADDRNAVVLLPHCRRRLRLRLRRGRAADLTQCLGQMPGERSDVRVVEHDRIGRRVLIGERPIQPVPQFHGHQRVHAQVEESHGGRRR